MKPDIEHSEQFIKDLKVNGGFIVPDNYFEELELRLQSVSDEPMLELETSEGGFVVPEAYFEDLESRILKKVPVQAKVIPMYQRGIFRISIAVAATLLLVSLLYLFETKKQPGPTAKIAEPTENEIIEYLNKEGYRIDLLCDAGWCNELNNTNKKETEPIEKYLLEHADEDLLIEEL
ncbi:MAG: hypothetical protein Q8M15_14235 [Bacteroidota bacterium]|nr:hypothetical protein [Bacteroidota bacterium]